MKNKKGQAAIEFLTTYGWAILAIALVGVIIVAYISGRGCAQGISGFEGKQVIVEDKSFPSATNATLLIRNLAGAQITVTDINLVQEDGTTIDGTVNSTTISNGGTGTVSALLGSALPDYGIGNCYSLKAVITFDIQGRLAGKQVVGTLKGSYPS